MKSTLWRPRLVLPNRLHVLRVELGVRLLERPVVDPDGFGFDRLVAARHEKNGCEGQDMFSDIEIHGLSVL